MPDFTAKHREWSLSNSWKELEVEWGKGHLFSSYQPGTVPVLCLNHHKRPQQIILHSILQKKEVRIREVKGLAQVTQLVSGKLRGSIWIHWTLSFLL